MIESALQSAAWTRGDWLSLFQLVFTFLGFAVAIWQLNRTANATIATKESLDRMRARLVGNDLLVVLPDLHRLEDDLDEALRVGNTDAAMRVLVMYNRTAGRIIAMLEVHDDDSGAMLVGLLKQVMKAASKAKAELSEGTQRELRDVLQLCVQKMTKVSPEISRSVAMLQKKVS